MADELTQKEQELLDYDSAVSSNSTFLEPFQPGLDQQLSSLETPPFPIISDKIDKLEEFAITNGNTPMADLARNYRLELQGLEGPLRSMGYNTSLSSVANNISLPQVSLGRAQQFVDLSAECKEYSEWVEANAANDNTNIGFWSWLYEKRKKQIKEQILTLLDDTQFTIRVLATDILLNNAFSQALKRIVETCTGAKVPTSTQIQSSITSEVKYLFEDEKQGVSSDLNESGVTTNDSGEVGAGVDPGTLIGAGVGLRQEDLDLIDGNDTPILYKNVKSEESYFIIDQLDIDLWETFTTMCSQKWDQFYKVAGDGYDASVEVMSTILDADLCEFYKKEKAFESVIKRNLRSQTERELGAETNCFTDVDKFKSATMATLQLVPNSTELLNENPELSSMYNLSESISNDMTSLNTIVRYY